MAVIITTLLRFFVWFVAIGFTTYLMVTIGSDLLIIPYLAFVAFGLLDLLGAFSDINHTQNQEERR